MKTDRFSDIIRRKLESIRPEFTEKDWARMQSTLQQASPPQPGSAGTGQPFGGSIWSAHPWLMAAATVSTVALVAFSIWQRAEINNLHQTIGQLKQKPDSMQIAPTLPVQERPTLSQTDDTHQSTPSRESMPASNQKQGLSGERDTVYITRYVAPPSRSRSEAVDERTIQGSETPPDQRYAETSRSPVSTSPSREQKDLNNNQKTTSYGVSSTPLSEKNTVITSFRNNANPSVPMEKSENQLANNTNEGRIRKGRYSNRNEVYKTNPINNQATTNGNGRSTKNEYSEKNIVADNTVVQTQQLQTEQAIATSGTSATYELATSRPLSTKNANWNAMLAQRANRIRKAWTPAVTEEVQTAPTSQPVRQLPFQLRVGVGGELASNLWNTGVVTEVLLGKHLTVGIGFVQATYTNKFSNDDDFEDRTHRNFRKEFGPGIDQFRDILNIDTRQIRYQIPVSLGYRIPLNQSLSLLPTISTYLNLNNAENVTFYCRLPLPPFQQTQRQFAQVDINKSQPINLINTLSLGTGIEWHSRHWALQGSPILNLPLQSNSQTMQPDQNWRNTTTVSLRARLLYQF